ncbi:phosphoserine transaminase [Stomatohabitans albus]|uniref:phosphoserine transaminase n=1 Tax=Stomatohabitans albus TaxID=3110766 RepID=UPI00300D85A7
MADITIPKELLPEDGRFGCGPSKVRDEAMDAFHQSGRSVMGTSHRKAPVKDMIARIRTGMAAYFHLPEDYTVALSNGGATLFWDAATFGLIEARSAHAVFGEFSSKFAHSVDLAPHLDDAVRIEAPPGFAPKVDPVDGVDVYALTHNETSTGVAMPVRRPSEDGLVLVDATSAAGAMAVDPHEFDAYYFSPQKAFGAEAGLWVALLSPAAQERIRALGATRPTPPSLDLSIVLDNSEQNQTYNTSAVASLFFLAHSVEAMAERGFDAIVAEAKDRSAIIYEWAEAREWAEPFVHDDMNRSAVVATVNLADHIHAAEVNRILRANGIYDTDAYRKLGTNQLRVGLWPSMPLADVQAFTASVDYVVEQLTS